MPRPSIKLRGDMVETYKRFLPLSKDHLIHTSFIDSTILVTSDDAVLALALTALILHEAHTIIDDHNRKVYDDVFYLHPDCINWDLLKKSSNVTYCPFKGYAVYYSLPNMNNVAWCYERPYEQVGQIAGLVAFYRDKVSISVSALDHDRLRTINDTQQLYSSDYCS